MNRLTAAVVAAAAIAMLALSNGCTPRAAVHASVGTLYLAGAAAELAAAATVLAYHDAHYHSFHCGHRHRYHHGHYVYWYGGQWEYYDGAAGAWYVY